MKLILFSLILAGYLWTDNAHGHETSAQDDLLPEFCVAIFLTAGYGDEADAWLETYELDHPYILFMQTNIELLLRDNELRGNDVRLALDGCIQARVEEERE